MLAALPLPVRKAFGFPGFQYCLAAARLTLAAAKVINNQYPERWNLSAREAASRVFS
jgi:hypothetical protein